MIFLNLILITGMILEKIENKNADKKRKIIMVCSLVMIICFLLRFYFANSRQLSDWGWWLDGLLLLALALYFFVIQNRIKNQTQQFVQWNDDKIIFRLKKNIIPVEIIKSEIKNINIKNRVISILKNSGDKVELDISDFDFETKNRIEEKFSHN